MQANPEGKMRNGSGFDFFPIEQRRRCRHSALNWCGSDDAEQKQ
jgi:hypothetical protein